MTLLIFFSIDNVYTDVYTIVNGGDMEMIKLTGTIQKWGNSHGIRLPKSVLDELSINDNETVEIFVDKASIVIKKSVRHYNSLQELLDAYDYHGYNESEEIDTGDPIGNEVW